MRKPKKFEKFIRLSTADESFHLLEEYQTSNIKNIFCQISTIHYVMLNLFLLEKFFK